jgi:hypothetical protein
MSVDLERQLAVYGEHLKMLAASSAPDTETPTSLVGNRTYWRGIAVALTAAAVVFLVIGSIALLSPFSGDETEMVTDSTTPSTVPGTTVPVTPIPDLQASGLINKVQDVALAPDGTVWAATRAGVVRWTSGESTPVVFGEEDGLPAADVDRIVVAVDGTVWASGSRWAAYYDETWESVEVDDPSPWTLVADPTGGVWTTGMSSNGDEVLLHIDRNGTGQISLPEGLELGSSVEIAVDATGRAMVVDKFDGHTVYAYDAGNWSELTTDDWRPGTGYSGIVGNIEIAPDEALWIATWADSDPEPGGTPASGVASFDGQTWTRYTTADGLASDAGTVVVGQDGTVWVIHGDTVSRRDGDTWSAYDVAGSSRSGSVAGSDGTLWLATDNGVIHFDGVTTTRYVVPVEMTPATVSFSLEPVGPAAPPVDAGSFGKVAWQSYAVPTGHSLMGGIDTAHGFAAIGGGAAIRTTTDGVNWMASEPPVEARHLVASGDDLYALAGGAVRLARMGATWEIVDELSVPDPGPEIRSEGGNLDFAERMAFGDGVTVVTARSRVFFSTDRHTFIPAVRGPDPAILAGAGESDSEHFGYAGGCDTSWSGGWPGEGSIGPVFATGSGFVAFTSGHPNDWNDFGLCRAVIWTSMDGSTWDLVSSESTFGEDAYVYAMAGRDGRFVAVGGRGHDDQGVLWASDDGTTWNEIPPEHVSGSITTPPWAIAAGEAGWVILYGDAGTDGGVRAMYSLDGLDWAVVGDELPDLWWAYGAPDVAVGTDRILVTYYDGTALIGEITR